jgi:hypothetical protein
MNILWCVTGPYPDPDTVIAYLLQTDLQAMMQEEGFAVPTGAGSASPASGGDKYAVSLISFCRILSNGQSISENQPVALTLKSFSERL